MKFFAVLVLFIAVAHANVLPIPVSPVSVGQEQAEIQEILAAIHHPSTDPTTAAALEQILLAILGVSKPEEDFEPISVGPAIIDQYNPIVVGPAIVDELHPIVVGPAVVDESAPIVPAPVVEYSNNRLQIILNISNIEIDSITGSPVTITGIPSSFSAVVVDQIIPTPVAVVDAEIAPTPVVVEELVPEPVVIGTPVLPAPIVVAPIEPTPVAVEELTPEAVIIGTPIIPSPVAVLPDELN